MTDYMLRQFMYRMRRQRTRRMLATWKANVEAASRKWDQNVSSVPLDAWRQAFFLKGVSSLG